MIYDEKILVEHIITIQMVGTLIIYNYSLRINWIRSIYELASDLKVNLH